MDEYDYVFEMGSWDNPTGPLLTDIEADIEADIEKLKTGAQDPKDSSTTQEL